MLLAFAMDISWEKGRWPWTDEWSQMTRTQAVVAAGAILHYVTPCVGSRCFDDLQHEGGACGDGSLCGDIVAGSRALVCRESCGLASENALAVWQQFCPVVRHQSARDVAGGDLRCKDDRPRVGL